MARLRTAEWLGEHAPGSNPLTMVRYDVVCVHTIVGFAPAHAAHFSVHGTGHIQQSRDTRYRSGANLHGNHRVIAIENEDHGAEFPKWSGSNVPPLTGAQVTANAKILAWAHETHGVPLQLNPDSRPGSRGLGYHRQGCDGNFGSLRFPGRVSGGELWSEAFGKVCPGDKRIAQLPEILRQAKAIVAGQPISGGEDDVSDAIPKYNDQGPAVVEWQQGLWIAAHSDTMKFSGTPLKFSDNELKWCKMEGRTMHGENEWADGVFKDWTKSATRILQRKLNIKDTGEPTVQTIARLEAARAASG